MKFMSDLLEEYGSTSRRLSGRRLRGRGRSRREDSPGRGRLGRDDVRHKVREDDEEFDFDVQDKEKSDMRDRVRPGRDMGSDVDMDRPEIGMDRPEIGMDRPEIGMDPESGDAGYDDDMGSDVDMPEDDLQQRVDALDQKMNELLQKISMYMSDKMMGDETDSDMDDSDFDDTDDLKEVDMDGSEDLDHDDYDPRSMRGERRSGREEYHDDRHDAHGSLRDDDDEFDLGPLDGDAFDDDDGFTDADRDEFDQQDRDDYYDRDDVRRGERFDDKMDMFRREY